MRLEDTVFNSMWQYPCLWGFDALARYRVMNHLFFTIGNGYEWKDGQLVEKFPEPKISWQMYIHEALGGDLQLQTNALRDEYVEIVGTDLDLPSYRISSHDRSVQFYPACTRFSKVFFVPKDVQPDWLSGAIEFLTFALNSPTSWWSSDSSDPSGTKQRNLCREQLNKLAVAQNVL